MLNLTASLSALALVITVALAAWGVSVFRRDVSIVDGLWSIFFLLALVTYMLSIDDSGPRSLLILGLISVWALRLSIYITVRNHGQPEDLRYQAIRRNNEPHFWFKSVYIVFLFQGFLAWVICLPALAAVSGQTAPGPLDFVGVALWLAGMTFEVVGDEQLTRFRKKHGSRDKVLNTGLWRYTRHPNYFGEATVWWGIYLLALSAGAWWTIFAPVLMTFLLLRVSGVAMMEKDISNRRPAYREYIRSTNAFFPGRPKQTAKTLEPVGVSGE